MKILFLGDYSNLHACLAKELRRRGHKADVLSDRGVYLNTQADFHLERTPGIIGGAKYLYKLFSILPQLKGYDAVQLINPHFLSLRPGKIKYFFDRISSANGGMYLSLAGSDHTFVKACADAELFRFSEFKVGDKPTQFLEEESEKMYGWLTDGLRRWNDYVAEHVKGAMSVLPEYDMAWRPVLGERVTFTNIPIEIESIPYSPLEIEGPLRIFIGMRGGMEIQKGTARMLAVAKDLEREMPDKVHVECVRNLPLSEYLSRMRGSHLVLDQFYAYAPATNALQAMAMGRVAGSGAEPEYYDYINSTPGLPLTKTSSGIIYSPDMRPVFQLSPLMPDLKGRLRELLLDPTPLYAMSREGRALVEMHNDVRLVVDRFLSVWEK